MNIVVSNGQNGAVVKQCQHDHHRCQWIEIKDQNGQRHEKQHAQRLGNPIDRVAVHSLKNFSALLDRIDDYERGLVLATQWPLPRVLRPLRLKQRCRSRLFLARDIIHSIASHANDMASFLQDIYNVELCSGNTWAKPSAFSIDSAT